MTMAQSDMSRDERQSAQAAYLSEFVAGEISGKEFVSRLQSVVGFSEIEARGEWQSVRDLMTPKIYDVKIGAMVSVPVGEVWRPGRITSFYGSGIGAIVEMMDDVTRPRFPFSLFELRLR